MEKYIKKEIEKTVITIKKLSHENCFIFSLISDIHMHPEKKEDMMRVNRTIENIKAVHSQCNIDALFFLGDLELVNSVMKGSYWTEEIANCYLESFRDKLLSCNENAFFVAGNHDGISARPSSPKNWYDKMIDKNKAASVKDQGYFYVDFPEQKIRAVCLMDSHLEKPEDVAYYGYTSDQLNWLANTALDIPENYKVLIFTHITIHNQKRIDGQKNSTDLIGIFNAFHKKGTYTSENVSADFKNRCNGEIVALFGGHDHVEWCGYACDIPFVQIETPSNLMHMPQYEDDWEMPTGAVPVDRELYTVSEDLWNTVIFDMEENTFHVVRFGAGEDALYKI